MKSGSQGTVPILITAFSEVLIKLSPRWITSHWIGLPVIAGSFIASLGMIQGLTTWQSYPWQMLILVALGLVLACMSVWIRCLAREISFNRISREVRGIPGHREAIPFNNIRTIILSSDDEGQYWKLLLGIHKKDPILLVKDCPLSFAVVLSAHLRNMIGCRLWTQSGEALNTDMTVDWEIPKAFPRPLFPLGWTVLASALAGISVTLSTHYQLGILSRLFMPKWMMIILIGFLSVYIVSHMHARLGLRIGANVAVIAILVIVLVSAAAVTEPAMSFSGLLPGVAGLLMVANAVLRKKRVILAIVVTAVCLLTGGPLTFIASSQFHALKNLRGDSIQTLLIQTPDENTVAVNDRLALNRIATAFKDIALLKTDPTPALKTLGINIIKPHGSGYALSVHTRGSAIRKRAICELQYVYLGTPLTLAVFSSQSLDDELTLLKELRSFWLER